MPPSNAIATAITPARAVRAISNYSRRCIIPRMIAPLTAEWRQMHRAKSQSFAFKKKMAPLKGPSVLRRF
jgi:hypothetical protein